MYFTQNQQVEKYVAERVGQHIIKLALHIRWASKVEAITLCLWAPPKVAAAEPQSFATLGRQRQHMTREKQALCSGRAETSKYIQIQDQILHGAEVNGNWGYSALKGIHTAGYQNGPCFSYFRQSNLSGYAEFVLLIWCWLYHSRILMQWSFPLPSHIIRYNILYFL